MKKFHIRFIFEYLHKCAIANADCYSNSTVYLDMELDPTFTFIHLENINLPNIYHQKTQEYLYKWGLKDNLSFQQYSFNESFQSYHKYHLGESFFKNDAVVKTLRTQVNHKWIVEGFSAKNVDLKYIPCTATNMSFFDKFKDPDNKVVWSSGTIQNTYQNEIDEFIVANNLQAALLDEESQHYNLYNSNEKEEFIFRIFELLVIGGLFCQYEDDLKPYLDVTKSFYKDLIRVQKTDDDKLSIQTIVFEVVATKSDDTSYFPHKANHRQNVAFLLINPHTRLATTFIHQFN